MTVTEDSVAGQKAEYRGHDYIKNSSKVVALEPGDGETYI